MKIAKKEKETALDDRQKILFKLNKDEDGYPPFDYERIWAKRLTGDLWELDNVPFFVTDVSNRDTISIEKDEDGDLIFKKLEKSGGHSTIRIYFNDEKFIKEVREEIKKMGCSSEGSNIKSLVAIDIPKDCNISNIRDFLEKIQAQGIIDIDDGHIQHQSNE